MSRLHPPPLERYAVAAALWTVGTAGLGALLGGLGLWHPWLVLPILLAVAVAAAWVTRGLPRIPLDGASAFALVAVAVLAGVGYGATHAEQVLPRRDAGSNLQAGISLATTGVRVVPVDPAPIGAPASLDVIGVTLASPAFYEVGSSQSPSVQPQFPVGPGALLSLGVWAGEPAGTLTPALLLAPLAAALALVTMGLLAASVLGARAGPVAALGLAVAFPIVHTARSTYSEPFATLTLAAGLLCLVLAARDRSARAAALAGVLVGGTLLIRIDALREVILVVIAATLYAVLGHSWTRPLVVGLGGSTAFGLLAAVALSPRYLGEISSSLVPLVVGGLLVAAAAIGALRATRRREPPTGPPWLPVAAGAAVVLVGIGFATRPLWQVARQSPDTPVSQFVAWLQMAQGLPVDAGRTYAERTVEWLAWWVGPIALGVALLALAVAAAVAVGGWGTGGLPPWAGALLVAAGSTALTLVRPGITPDHPWAERRLVIAICLVVLLVVAAAAWCLRRPWPALARWGSAGAVVAALLVPAATATWPHASHRVELGSAAAVAQVCEGFDEGDVALVVDPRGANEWPQVLRGQCGVPTLSTTGRLQFDPPALRFAVGQVREAVQDGGGRLVLVGAQSPDTVRDLSGIEPELLVDRTVEEDQRLLEERPDALVPLQIALWTAPASG